MSIDVEAGPQHKCSALADLAALLCHGGLAVDTPGKSGFILVRSTIQLDGDITICVAEPALIQATTLNSHLIHIETRIHRVALLVRRSAWVAHGTITAAVSGGWLWALLDSPMLESHLTTAAVWIALSVGSTGIIEYLLRIPFVQKILMTSTVSGLSRLAVG